VVFKEIESLKTIDLSGKPFHFIGIGGIGMSAIAYILAKLELPVSGSDIHPNHITDRLHSAGVHIFNNQEATNLEFFQPLTPAKVGSNKTINLVEERSIFNNCLQLAIETDNSPQIVCSTAINENNPEYIGAKERGYPIFHRSDVLAALVEKYHSIAVAGTHGKTTTSSAIGYMLLKANLDPIIIVGGEVKAWEGNARLGQGNILVAEADESDGSLSKYAPKIGIITNIELDHPDHYQNLEQVIDTFQAFSAQCETVIGCIDCQIVRDRISPDISYSLDPSLNADYTVKKVIYHASGSVAEVWERGQLLGEMRLRLLGKHNVSNALATIAVGRKLGLSFATITEAIATFEGAKRRFEYRGTANDIVFIDDYAHHPSELKATIAAARLQVGKNRAHRVVSIFQPHRYSRTLTFLEEFGTSFNDADVVVVTDIYSAGEADLGQVSGQKVAEAIAAHHPQVYYQPNLNSLSNFLDQLLQPKDLALFLGAGNVNQVIPQVISLISSQERKLA
jgi:UDP-N-acetylmuramate--alanine ligase